MSEENVEGETSPFSENGVFSQRAIRRFSNPGASRLDPPLRTVSRYIPESTLGRVARAILRRLGSSGPSFTSQLPFPPQAWEVAAHRGSAGRPSPGIAGY